MLQAEFLQAAQVTVYDYYEPCEQRRPGGVRGRGLKGKRPAKDWARWEG